MQQVTAANRQEWRAWLERNHDRENEVWLVYYKKGTGQASINYEESVEEALCFGWIDSIIKKLDEQRYARKFNPRQEGSGWSALNIKRAEWVIAKGLMTEAGMRRIEAAKKNGNWDSPVQPPDLSFEVHPEFAAALAGNAKANKNFQALAASYRKQYLGWIEVAKKPETRQRRIAEAIQLLERGEKLGLR